MSEKRRAFRFYADLLLDDGSEGVRVARDLAGWAWLLGGAAAFLVAFIFAFGWMDDYEPISRSILSFFEALVMVGVPGIILLVSFWWLQGAVILVQAIFARSGDWGEPEPPEPLPLHERWLRWR